MRKSIGWYWWFVDIVWQLLGQIVIDRGPKTINNPQISNLSCVSHANVRQITNHHHMNICNNCMDRDWGGVTFLGYFKVYGGLIHIWKHTFNSKYLLWFCKCLVPRVWHVCVKQESAGCWVWDKKVPTVSSSSGKWRKCLWPSTCCTAAATFVQQLEVCLCRIIGSQCSTLKGGQTELGVYYPVLGGGWPANPLSHICTQTL